MANRMEWVEIIEPRTKNHMYANLITGECVWHPPAGQKVKKTDHNQWWELYDANTLRFYYYNATNQQTVWQRPENCDIIPLAKLQTLKQNTEVRDDENGRARRLRESASTQSTQTEQNGSPASTVSSALTSKKDTRYDRPQPGSVRKLSSQTQTTPLSSPKETKRQHLNHHHHNHNHKCAHAHVLRNSNSQGSNDQSLHGSDPVRQQLSAGFQQRSQISRGQSFFDEEAREVWNNDERLSSNIPSNSSRVISSSHDMGRTPSPRSPAACSHELPSGSLSRARVYENHSINENVPLHDTQHSLPSTSSTFSRTSPIIAVLPRRQCSFDHKNHGVENGDGSLPYRARNDNVYQAPLVLAGIRSVESTPRVQRRNTDVPLPQIRETVSGLSTRNDAFTISGGTPMQSRKRKSLPKSNGHPSPTPQNGAATPSGASQPASGSSSQSHSSLESKRSFFGSRNRQSTTVPAPHNFGDPQLRVGNQQEKAFLPPMSQRPIFQDNIVVHIPGVSSFMKNYHSSAKLRRTISVDRHDLKSPSSDGSSSKTSVPFSPQLQRRVTSSKIPPRLSSGELEEDRKAEALLRAAKEEYEAKSSAFMDRRVTNNSHRFAPEVPVRRYVASVQEHSDLDTDSEDNDADVEDSDDFDEDDEDDEDLDEMMAADPSGKNRYGHLSPSQLRTHPNYCAIDRAMKSLHVEPVAEGNQSSDEEDVTALREKVQCMNMNIMDTRHPSLRRKPNQGITGPKLPGLEKSQSVQTELSAQQLPRPMSVVLPTQSETSLISSTKSSSPICRPFYPGINGSATLTRDRSFMDNDAETNRATQVKLNDHTKGIFRKKVSIASLLSWSKDSIKKPLIMTSDKSVKKEACTMYRLVQMYMGDRKAKDNKSQDEIALELTRLAWQKPSLRDELFIQICKQTTENHKPESLRRGWELMAICLAFFPPSTNFFAYLHTYISRFQSPACNTFEVQVSHYASHCLKRLERMSQTGAKRGIRKPTVEEIQQARVQIFHPSLFGNTLEDVMQLQKERFPDRSLPWIQTILSEEVLRLGGTRTEGIFRVPGDIDEVNMLKVRMDRWNKPDCSDPHVPSSLLKLWYRELYEPLIPARYYDLCIQNCNNPAAAVRLAEGLPEINRLVLTYLIRFLQLFAQPENVLTTKMDAPNLAMVMAPNCLRCMSDDPQIIFENTRKEMAFIRLLMQHLDTSWIDGLQ